MHVRQYFGLTYEWEGEKRLNISLHVCFKESKHKKAKQYVITMYVTKQDVFFMKNILNDTLGNSVTYMPSPWTGGILLVRPYVHHTSLVVYHRFRFRLIFHPIWWTLIQLFRTKKHGTKTSFFCTQGQGYRYYK